VSKPRIYVDACPLIDLVKYRSDQVLLKKVEALAKLNLRVCRASDTQLLPPEFLQADLPLS
jgi:hypothetical protein